MLFPPEAAALSEASSATSWLTQDCRASCAHNYRLCVAKHCCNFVTSWALNVHEIRVGVLDQALELMFALLLSSAGVE